jgi:glucosyl-3-phosphoglycerate synthase
MTRDLSLAGWVRRRTFNAGSYSLKRVLASKASSGGTISVILPAREVAATIGPILDTLIPLRRKGVLDEIVVIDAASADGTGSIARRMGVQVHQRAELMPELGPSRGKGDAIWRGLGVTSGDIVAIVDSDTQNFGPHFALGLIGPLLEDASLHLVKGSFERPLQLGVEKMEGEGGRVTELTARPLINLLLPQLAGFLQPLAGEVAARRSLLETLPMPVGYGVEIAMLIDALRAVGLEAMGQVELGRREDANQPLKQLSLMAYTVAATILGRGGAEPGAMADAGTFLFAAAEGVEPKEVDLLERPPLASLKLDKSAEGH